MPVGTKATVKTLDPDEIRALGAPIILGNTYHLVFRPGTDVIAELDALASREEAMRVLEAPSNWEFRPYTVVGVVQDVIYVGPDTRYVVALEAGARLVVTQQNLATSSTEALALEGKTVRLVWKRQHELPIADGT